MFTIEMLPASHGDCLWIEYGTAKAPRRVLIDGGPAYSYAALAERLQSRLGHLPQKDRRFELLVITHVDSDHIGGILEFLLENPLGIKVDDVWFNAWQHLPDVATDKLGPVQGEQVSALITARKLPWNKAFGERAVVVPDTGELPSVSLKGGLKLTLLSPTVKELARFRPTWNSTVKKAGLVAGSAEDALKRLREKGHDLPPDALGEKRPDPRTLVLQRFTKDTSPANGSSIAMLAEYKGKSCLLTGDALADVVSGSVARLVKERGDERLTIDALKLSHHGGSKNTSSQMLEGLGCKMILLSTDGARFGHPDPQSVARAIMAGGKGISLHFNYRSQYNEIWDDRMLKREFGYETIFPENGSEGLVVTV